jgi:hypothetical protein
VFQAVVCIEYAHFICSIKCAFVGESNFNIIKMHGTTIKNVGTNFSTVSGCIYCQCEHNS